MSDCGFRNSEFGLNGNDNDQGNNNDNGGLTQRRKGRIGGMR